MLRLSASCDPSAAGHVEGSGGISTALRQRGVDPPGAWLSAISTLFESPGSRLLEVDWVSRQVDAGLPFGLAVLTVPVRGGSAQAWYALVSELQAESVREPSSTDGGFHLISAARAADGGWLEVGIFATGDQESLLREQLDVVVERVNAARS